MRRLPVLLAACLLLAGCGAVPPPALPAPEITAPRAAPAAEASLPLELMEYPGAETAVESSTAYGDVTVSAVRYRVERTDVQPGRTVSVVDLDLRFPQISGVPEAAAVNLMLLDAALQTVWWDVTAANAAESFRQEERIYEELDGDSKAFYRIGLVGEMDFTLLLCDGRYLSVLYAGRNEYGNGVNLQTYPLTIDLEQAAWADLTAFTDVDALLDAVRAGNYEVLKGHYEPGGWEGPEMAEDFAAALEEQSAADYLLEYRRAAPDGTPIRQTALLESGEVTYPECDVSCARNFGLDGGALYLQFAFYDSLDGYVLLKVPGAGA